MLPATKDTGTKSVHNPDRYLHTGPGRFQIILPVHVEFPGKHNRYSYGRWNISRPVSFFSD